MAIRTRTGNRAETRVEYRSKSDHARALFREGKTVAEVTRIVPGMGYAFAYGVAKRAGLAATAADRRPQKTITTSNGSVFVKTAIGTVEINLETGKVKTPRIAKVTTPAAE